MKNIDDPEGYPKLSPGCRERQEANESTQGINTDVEGLSLITNIVGFKAAEAISSHYGGALHKLKNASYSDLAKLEGVGLARARRIKAALDLGVLAIAEERRRGARIHGSRDAYLVFEPILRHLPHENFVVLLLNARHRVVGIEQVARGGSTMCAVEIRNVFEPAIREGAVAIICAHNHPSGDPSPSSEDIQLTSRIWRAGDALQIRVLDHLIIGDGMYVSLADRGTLRMEI